MPTYSPSLGDVTTTTLCASKGGLLSVFWIDKTNIDWTAMLLAANYNVATNSVLNWVILGGATWGEVTFQAKNGRLDGLFTSDNDYYEVTLPNLIIEGRDKARTLALANATTTCGILAQVFDNNGYARIIGKEHVNGAWVDPLENFKISRHLDTTGAFGAADDKTRDEFDMAAEHRYPFPYSDVDLATMRTL